MNARAKAGNTIAPRNKRGSMALELAVGAMITISILALALNFSFAMLSYGINDRACREAARAAAQGANRQEAGALAGATINSFNRAQPQNPRIVIESLVYTDFGGTPQADQSPSVAVSTRSSAQMPAAISVFGQEIFPALIPVRKTYVFPIVRLTPPNT